MNISAHATSRAVVAPLAGMVLTQTCAVMSLVTVPVLATEIARESGVAASLVGFYTSLIFGAAMFTSAASGGVIQRLDPVRTNQMALVLSATAMLLALTANPWWIAHGELPGGALARRGRFPDRDHQPVAYSGARPRRAGEKRGIVSRAWLSEAP